MPHRSSTSNEIYKQIGQRIRTRRLAKGMTQQQLGEKLQITFQQIQKYETGQNRVDSGRLYEIAIALNVPPSKFYPNDDNGKDELLSLLNGPDEVRMVQAFKRVCPKYRRLLLEMVELCALRMYPSCDD